MGKRYNVDFYNVESNNLHSGMEVEANDEEEARTLACQSFEAEYGINPSVYRTAVTEQESVEAEAEAGNPDVGTDETPVPPELVVKEAE